jgi:hypothetical protein
VNFRLSSGTLDKLAGVYAPPQKYRSGSGGGRAKGAKAGGLAIALLLPKRGEAQTDFRTTSQMKHAFRGSSHARVSDRAVMTMERTARGVPEVVVRVTGRQHGGGHVLANFSYISRLGHGEDKELALHTSDGEVLRDGRDMQILAQDWQEWEMGADSRRQGATSISMILSMPTGTDPERLQDAALDFARTEFANRSWVASLHVDRDHPHVHLTFARRDHDGRRFHPDRDDLFRYRQRFAEKLRERGIEANATPTRARGIDPAHEHIAVQKIRDKGLVPRLDVSRAERAQRLSDQGIADPVEAVLASRQATVRAVHARSIDELLSSRSFVDQVIAQSLEKFVTTMPAPEANSARAVREAALDRGVSAPAPDVDARQVGVDNGPDRIAAAVEHLTECSRAMREKLEVNKAQRAHDSLAAAIERSRAMREKIEAKMTLRTASERVDSPPAERRTSGISEDIRSLIEKSERQTTSTVDKLEEVLREMNRDREQRERERASHRHVVSSPGTDSSGSVSKRWRALKAAAEAGDEQAKAPGHSRKRETDEQPSIPSDPFGAPGAGRVAPFNSQHLTEAKGTAGLDPLSKSLNRLDLPGTIQRYARAALEVTGMEKNRLPVLPHQRTELNEAGEALDKMRYNGLRHFVTAITRNPGLVHDAAAGDFRSSLEAMAVEARVDMDPRLRAERFMERWWTVENERRLGDPMVAVVRKEMIDGLYDDPALRAELERSAPELGLAQQQTPEQMLQQWQIEIDRERDRQQDRGFSR